MDSQTREHCKIRKRGNSSSSSSSLIRKYRFKRAILVGKRGGSTTPVPSWKTIPMSPSPALQISDSANCPPLTAPKSNDASVSARKLAATLWEINTVPSPTSRLNHQTRALTSRDKPPNLPLLSDPSYTSLSEKMDGFRGGNGYRNSGTKAALVSQKIPVSEGLDYVNNSSLVEIETHAKARARRGCTKTRLKDVSYGLKASKEILKVLTRVWGIEDQNSSGAALVSALGVELDRARIQVNQLIKEHHFKSSDMEHLLKQFEHEKAAWKRKEQERIRNVVEELEVEKKLRRQAERLNKKLGKELAEAKESLALAMKELEGEKRAKEILEQVCDELARGIGENRAQVEELKKESDKVREEVEKERQMLQLADVLREERVQMKLSEAKYQFEEKNAAVERMRNELEAYFRDKLAGKENGDAGSPNLKAYLKETRNVSSQKAEIKVNGKEEMDEIDGDDSEDSDLHSIELNMDNCSKSYKWSYANDGDDPKRVSVDRDFKGRKSISENIQWGSICLQRRNSHSVDGPDFDFSEFNSNSKANDLEDEYKAVASPTKQWGKNGAVSDSSPVLQGDGLKFRATRKIRNSTSSRH